MRADADLLGKGLGSLPLSAEQQARLVELAAEAQSTARQPGQVCSPPVLNASSTSVLHICARYLCSVSVLHICAPHLCSVSVLHICARCLFGGAPNGPAAAWQQLVWRPLWVRSCICRSQAVPTCHWLPDT